MQQGGSTITQQLVKNSIVGTDQNLSRKMREAVLAVELEKEMTKEEILERYLNTIYFGNGAYGVQAAAELYFNVNAKPTSTGPRPRCSPALIRNPNPYDPFTHPEIADRAAGAGARRPGPPEAHRAARPPTSSPTCRCRPCRTSRSRPTTTSSSR